jgi:hypothetical protein
MNKSLRRVLSFVCFASIAAAAAAQQLSCAKCHTDQAKTQPGTDMAHAMETPGNDPALTAHAPLEHQIGVYHYKIAENNGAPSYSVTDGTNTITLPIVWPFGRNSQTYVLEYKGQLYESFVSYYPGANGLDKTVGDQSVEPKTLEQAMGRLLSPFEAKSCFGCHSAGSIVNRRLDLSRVAPGVTCLRCHSDAGKHLQSIAQGKLDNLPPRLKTLSAEDVSTFCGQCHRTWQTVVRNRWLGPINLRFQPYRLENSKCFDGIDRRISCIACHDPHRQLVTDDKTYDAKCLACHSSKDRPTRAMVCHTATENCVSCHMPKIDLPGAHRAFTDHQIRIVHPGEPYPN